MDFKDKNILVSGGSSGIGFALAKKLSRLGASITILARRKELLETAIKEIKDCATFPEQKFNYISADVSDFKDLKSAFENDHIDYDFLFTAAGNCYPGEFINTDVETFEETINTDYLGTVYLTKLILPRMIAKKSGYIIRHILPRSMQYGVFLGHYALKLNHMESIYQL